jgi:Sec-independent protein translocase protein TatA
MISIGQILVIVLLALLLFGDLPGILKKISLAIKGTSKVSEKDTTKIKKD